MAGVQLPRLLSAPLLYGKSARLRRRLFPSGEESD